MLGQEDPGGTLPAVEGGKDVSFRLGNLIRYSLGPRGKTKAGPLKIGSQCHAVCVCVCVWPHDVPITWSSLRITFLEALVILHIGAGFILLFCLQSTCTVCIVPANLSCGPISHGSSCM